MNDEVRELLNRARREKQILSVSQLQIRFGDVPWEQLGKHIKREQTRTKEIAKWLEERGFRLRKIRNADHYSISLN